MSPDRLSNGIERLHGGGGTDCASGTSLPASRRARGKRGNLRDAVSGAAGRDRSAVVFVGILRWRAAALSRKRMHPTSAVCGPVAPFVEGDGAPAARPRRGSRSNGEHGDIAIREFDRTPTTALRWSPSAVFEPVPKHVHGAAPAATESQSGQS